MTVRSNKSALTRAALLILALLAFAALAFGCNTATNGNDTTTTTAAETEAAVADAPIKLIENGVCNYKIIRPENDSADSPATQTALTIINAVKSATGVSPVIATDWVKRGEENDSTTKEILVGLTTYKESISTYAGCAYGDWCVKIIGNKIVVCGYGDAGLAKAAAYLSDAIRDAARADKANVTLEAANVEKNITLDAMLSSLPVYDGGTYSATYDAGGGNQEIIIKSTDKDAYSVYIEKLKKAGYSVYTSKEMADNLFTTLKNDKYTINAGFYKYETSARIIIEPLTKDIGLKSDDVYTKVCEPLITMLGLEYKDSNGDPVSNGLSILMRLEDGRFVIIDGGFNRSACADKLIAVMREQSKAYAKDSNDITIAAWIITHAHGDHGGMLWGQYEKFNKFKVERLLVNFISDSELAKAKASTAYAGNFSVSEGTGYASIETAGAVFGAEEIKVHVGQDFYLGGARFEVLYTTESYAPAVLNALNTTSLIIKCTIGGQVFMITGDATGPAFNICAKMYGSYLKSDIVQIAHHGYTTWGTSNGTMAAYGLMAPSVILWDQGNAGYPNYIGKDYNQALVTSGNVKEIYVAGSQGDVWTLELPYTAKTTGAEHDRAVSAGAKN